MNTPVWGCAITWRQGKTVGSCDRHYSGESTSNEYVCCEMITGGSLGFINLTLCLCSFPLFSTCPVSLSMVFSHPPLSVFLTDSLYICIFVYFLDFITIFFAPFLCFFLFFLFFFFNLPQFCFFVSFYLSLLCWSFSSLSCLSCLTVPFLIPSPVVFKCSTSLLCDTLRHSLMCQFLPLCLSLSLPAFSPTVFSSSPSPNGSRVAMDSQNTNLR